MQITAISLGVLIANLISILASCTKDEEKNSSNVIQWIIRNIKKKYSNNYYY